MSPININLENHPFQVTVMLMEKYGEDIIFEFSFYIHKPQQVFDDRHTFNINGKDLTSQHIKELIKNLKENEELALHSKVKIGTRNYHIPMIDFSTAKWDSIQAEDLGKYLPTKVFKQLVLYSSGRSFHGYSTELLKPNEYRNFMGRLLLVNSPNHSQVVDTRWVGHRLIGGFSSLRWSCNTNKYFHLPKKIDFLF